MIQKEIFDYHVQALIQLACRSGASAARRIPAKRISVKEELARLCLDPQCDQYGLSAGCPPHVSGPPGFRKLRAAFAEAIVLKIDVASEVLFSDERRKIMKLLHETVAAVEQAAVRMGYKNSRGFAGGSCKPLFCPEEADCRVVSESEACRYPQSARPSMSGFGIDVGKLMRSAGWTGEKAVPEADSKMTWVAGLVLIG